MINMKQKTITMIITIMIIFSFIIIVQQNKIEILKVGVASKEINNYKNELKTGEKENIKNVNTDLKISIQTDKTSYSWLKEPIHIKLTIQNNGNTKKVLKFSTTQQHDFIIKNQYGITIYKWSERNGFIQVFTELTLLPGENKTWNYSWKQSGHIFAFMPYHKILPGTYTIIGCIPSIKRVYQNKTQIKTGNLLNELFS